MVLFLRRKLLAFFFAASSCCNSTVENQSNVQRIPNIVFRTHEDRYYDLHHRFKQHLNITMIDNPGYIQVYFDSDDRKNFIRMFYPQFLSGYLSLVPGCYQSDIWRLLAVHRFGGIYVDMGMRFITKIRNIIRVDDEFVSSVELSSLGLVSGFIAARRGHPVVWHIIERIMDNVENERYNCNSLDVTGPKVYGRGFNSFFGQYAPEPIRSGSYLIKSFKFRLLQYEVKRDKKGNPIFQCIKEDNVCVIHNKFPGYLEAAYKNGGSHYSDYYTTKTVYRASTNNSKNFNNLIIENGDYYYVKNETIWKFPKHSNDTIREMGFEECMAVPVTVNVKNISVLKFFTSNVSRNIELVELWGRNKLQDLAVLKNGRTSHLAIHQLDALYLSYVTMIAGSSIRGDICHNTFTFPVFQSLQF